MEDGNGTPDDASTNADADADADNDNDNDNDNEAAGKQPHTYAAFSPDGHTVQWVPAATATAVAAGAAAAHPPETVTIEWQNEAWTVTGVVGREQVQYVLRISPTWHVRQFLLFRDLEEPDLWLGTDGSGRWGEMNGAHRPELDGCVDLDITCTPFTNTLPIRRLPLRVGDSADITVACVDVETLDIRPDHQRYTRVGQHTWRIEQLESGFDQVFDVDEFGLVRDYPSLFRRVR